jgi:hypothetical protein
VSSFNRAQYLRVYEIAKRVWWMGELMPKAKHEEEIGRLAMELMDMCEGVLGQLNDRPDRRR